MRVWPQPMRSPMTEHGAPAMTTPAPNTDNPLIVQSDRTILLEVDNPQHGDARDQLGRFAEIVKCPEHIHTYRISPLSLWNAASAGMGAAEILAVLDRYSKYAVPDNLRVEVNEYIGRYGSLKLVREGEQLILTTDDAPLAAEVWHNRVVRRFLDRPLGPHRLLVLPHARGHVKQALIHIGFPVEDLAGYVDGPPLPFDLRDCTAGGAPVAPRRYQVDAADAFHAGGSARGGAGVIVLPCGAGKTMVGMVVMSRLRTHTLILVTSITAVRQWIRELLEKTTLTADEIGEYSGEAKQQRPVTITTYQMLTWRKSKSGPFPHFEIFNASPWGLIVYDEVHLLPAPVFRVTAEIQACRRLGLTATLVREDHKESDVFSLIGPKKYDVPWKVLEQQGWIATALCTEVRVRLPDDLRVPYATDTQRAQFRIASENPMKLPVLDALLARHGADRVMVIGQYIDQLRLIARHIGAPLIMGSTPNRQRERLYEEFRSGQRRRLVVSKVGNFSVDLPDANVLVQVSGTFGSRQEEAQRLGRILRPKTDGSLAHFYSIVTRDSRDQDFAANRQLFLAEQGYSYRIVDEGELGGLRTCGSMNS